MTYVKGECYQIEIARVGIDFGTRKSGELYISKTLAGSQDAPDLCWNKWKIIHISNLSPEQRQNKPS